MQAKKSRRPPRALARRPSRRPARASAPGRLADARGYSERELSVLFTIGYHYLMSGGLDLARTIFEGLLALAPGHGSAHLALGVLCDREGDIEAACAHFRRAQRLSPKDPRPDLNLAELRIGQRRYTSAEKLLQRAQKKAERSEPALYEKASAILAQLERRGRR